jgi:hypothetical protein
MKTKLTLISLFLISNLPLLISQVPQGFNYQAIARGADGKEIANTTLQVKISILTDTSEFYAGGTGTYIWEEQQTVTTNNLGLFILTVGNPLATKIQGSATSFSAIDWKLQPLFIGTKINNGSWKNMGTSRLWSVPYAMNSTSAAIASNLAGPVDKLSVTGSTSVMDEALFEVKNKTGQIVFAVYNEGVRVYVDDGLAKGTGKGGFAIGSFGTAKAPSQEFFVVSPDSIRAYIDNEQAKPLKGGFAIGGFNKAKAPGQEYLRVTRDSTRVYVNQLAKGTKGGFAIGGFDPAKGPINNFMNLTPNNYFIGHQAGSKNTTGLYNNFIGYQAGLSNTDGGYNTFIGYQAGMANMGGNSNVFVGHLAGEKNTSGTGNVFLGINSGQDFESGYNNTFIGTLAGQNFTNGSSNIFIGRSAGTGFNFPVGTIGGTNNIFIGDYSAYYITSGGNNVILGNLSGFYFTTGFDNLFAGSRSGYSNTSGGENVFLGSSAGYSSNIGNQNVFIGIRAGYNAQSGSGNTFIGSGSGYSLATGDGNIFIGKGSGGNLTAQSNRLYIENSAADKNNALIYGEFDTKLLTVNGKLGIGKTNPLTRLDILGGNWNVAGSSEGDFRIGDANYRLKIGVATAGGGSGDVRMTAMGGTNRIIMGGNGVDVLAVSSSNVYPWTDNAFSLGLSTNRWSVVYSANGVVTTSDIRLKNNIQELDYGLESIMKLEPVSYIWKDGSDKSRKLGLVAQDVDKVISEVVDKGNDPSHTLGINYSELVPVLIKGMQEQQKQIESAVQENRQLKSDLKDLMEEVELLRAAMMNFQAGQNPE